MKYGINRYDNSEVINSYIKSDNSIIIIYLDESVKEIPYSEDNENKVLNEMIIQAIVREETELNQLPIKIKYDFLNIVSRAVISFLMFSSIYTNRYYYVNKSVVYKIVYSLVVAFCSANIFKYINELICDYKKSIDIVKYHEFFELKEELDKYGDSLIEDNLKLKDVININTLDNYSIDNIKEIINKLKDDEQIKVLSKKNK